MRLIQGDCHTKLEELDTGSVDLCLTDPPYNTTGCEWDQQPLQWQKIWQELHRIGKQDAAFVFNCQEPFTHKLINSNENEFRYKWIWSKNIKTNVLNANKMPLRGHEEIAVFYRKLPTYNPQWEEGEAYETVRSNSKNVYEGGLNEGHTTKNDGKRYPSTVIDGISVALHQKGFTNHPTEKPVELNEYMIKTYTDEGETVLDFTMGSGSTGVAAVQSGRDFIGIEQDEEYYQVAKDRINDAERKREQTQKFFEI